MNDKPTYEELETIAREYDELRMKIKQIFDLSPDLIGTANLEGYFERVNSSFEKILGYSPEEFCSRPFLDFVHDDDYEKTAQALANASHGNKLIEIENRYRCKNGDYKWIDWKVWDAQYNNNYIAAGRDITESKKAKEALKASEQRYKTLTDVAEDCIFIKNIDREYIFVNPAMVKLFSCNDEQDLLWKTPEQLFDPEYAAIVKDVDDRTFNGEKVSKVKNLTINGVEHVFHTIQVPLSSTNGKVSQICGIVRDISEITRAQEQQKEIEAQQLQIQKLEAVGTLAGGIAHDFNNILGVIIGNASYAQHQLDKNEPLHEILSNIQEGATQAQSLTQQLLTFARGGVPIKKSTDLNLLIKESARFVTRGSKSRCDFALSDDLWPADIDSGQINQAIANIVINAFQAMPDGGAINIKTENISIKEDSGLPLSSGNYIKTVFEDQGVGITEETLPKIFDPYFSTKNNGIGLGLTSTFSIIKRHGGHITVCSNTGQGTIFTVFLPASLKEYDTSKTTDTEHFGNGRILVMDDHEQILKMAGFMLGHMGYDTVFATDGTQAIEIFLQAYQSGNPFDLVILDLTVPGGMGGAEAIQALVKIDPEIKAIVSSGYSNDPIMANYEDYGFYGILPKPYTTSQLADVLNKLFGEKPSC